MHSVVFAAKAIQVDPIGTSYLVHVVFVWLARESGHCRYLLDALPHYSFVAAQEGTSWEVYTPESSYKLSIQYVMIVKVGSQVEGLWCCSQCALGFQIREHSVHYFCPLCHFFLSPIFCNRDARFADAAFSSYFPTGCRLEM